MKDIILEKLERCGDEPKQYLDILCDEVNAKQYNFWGTNIYYERLTRTFKKCLKKSS